MAIYVVCIYGEGATRSQSQYKIGAYKILRYVDEVPHTENYGI